MPGYTEKDILSFKDKSEKRQLNSRDRRLVNGLNSLTERDRIEDMYRNTYPANLIELDNAIKSAKSPKIKALLMAEKEDILSIIQEDLFKKVLPTSVTSTDRFDFTNMFNNLWGTKE